MLDGSGTKKELMAAMGLQIVEHRLTDEEVLGSNLGTNCFFRFQARIVPSQTLVFTQAEQIGKDITLKFSKEYLFNCHFT